MSNDLFLRAKNGDSNAVMEVIKSFEGLIVNTAKKYTNYNGNAGAEFEDLKQVGCQAVLQGIRKVDDERLITAAGFIISCVRNSIISYASPSFSSDLFVSLSEEIGPELKYEDIIVSDSHVEEESVRNIMLGKIKSTVDELPQNKREILEYYFNEPYGGMKRYADLYGKDYRRVRYEKDLIIEELKDIFI